MKDGGWEVKGFRKRKYPQATMSICDSLSDFCSLLMRVIYVYSDLPLGLRTSQYLLLFE